MISGHPSQPATPSCSLVKCFTNWIQETALARRAHYRSDTVQSATRHILAVEREARAAAGAARYVMPRLSWMKRRISSALISPKRRSFTIPPGAMKIVTGMIGRALLVAKCS